MTAVAVAGLFLFLLAPIPFGLWQPGEPVSVGLWCVAALAAFWTRYSPTLAGLVLMVALTLGLGALQPFPVRSWMGTPELGIGGAWWLSLLILAAVMGRLDLAKFGPCVALAGAVILAMILAWPAYFGTAHDWAAFVGFAVAAAGGWIAIGIGLGLVAVSGSKTAVVLTCLVPGIWSALHYLNRPWTRAGAAVALPAALTVATFLVPAPSLESRALLWSALWHGTDAWTLAFGIGWGGYNDLLLTALPEIERAAPAWEGIGGGAFHSHSMYVEALSALGASGLVAMLAVVAAPAWYGCDRWAVACWYAQAGLMALWFPLPQCVPFLAFGLVRAARS